MKNFDPRYNDLPKTEIHIHLEGSIRTQTIIDIARDDNLKLPAYNVEELDRHVKVYDQMRDLAAVLEANGRIEIVLSIEVNKFPQGIAGFVFGGDLFSRSLCASSDSSEVFYGHVPDPGNVAARGPGRRQASSSRCPRSSPTKWPQHPAVSARRRARWLRVHGQLGG